MSLTGWMNNINRENQERWMKLRYDQVAVDFVKTLRAFPLLRLWSDTFAKELLMTLDPEQFQEYRLDLESFVSETVDIRALQAITKTIYIDFSAYHMINPLRQRLEQYLKFPPKRTPGLLDDFYKKYEDNKEFREDILRSSRKVFKPGLQNFWNSEDLEELTNIRDSLFNCWDNSDFELTDKEYLHCRLRYCLAIRMDMVEMTAAMNIIGGDQWIEVLSTFLRRTTPAEGFNLTDDLQDRVVKLESVESELHHRSQVIDYLCAPERNGIPENYLNCDGRGLSIPPYEAFYGTKNKEADTHQKSSS